ncbi:MAG: O-antigen ligase family protein [Bacteroidales bacterium]|nr:O-antigen ligase family protein [Bacteroidales bacterium]
MNEFKVDYNFITSIIGGLFVFLIPFDWQTANYVFGLFALLTVINPALYSNIKTTSLSKNEKFLILISIVFIIWEFVTLLWSEDVSRGIKRITGNIPMIAMPILFIASKISKVFKKPEQLLNVFCVGTIISSILCLAMSFSDCNYEYHGEDVFDYRLPDYRDRGFFEAIFSGYSFFSYSNLSHFVHPSYMSLYFIIVIVYAYTKLYENKKNILALVFLIIYSCGFLALLGSRANIIALTLVCVIIILYEILIKKHKKIGIVITVLLTLSLILFFSTGRGLDVLQKFNNAVEAQTNNSDKETIKEERQNVNQRLGVWSCAFQVIKENPLFGVGVGDGDQVLYQHYIDNDLQEYADNKYNSHNQFLDVWIGCGIIGLLLVLLFLGMPLYYGFKKHNLLLIAIPIAIIVNCLFEVMLNRSAGCFPISFILTILIINLNQEKKELS